VCASFTANPVVRDKASSTVEAYALPGSRMSDEVIIYIAPPVTERGLWRVRSDGRPEREVASEEAAVAFAAEHARMIERAGGVAIVRIERADGTWETFRA